MKADRSKERYTPSPLAEERQRQAMVVNVSGNKGCNPPSILYWKYGPVRELEYLLRKPRGIPGDAFHRAEVMINKPIMTEFVEPTGPQAQGGAPLCSARLHTQPAVSTCCVLSSPAGSVQAAFCPYLRCLHSQRQKQRALAARSNHAHTRDFLGMEPRKGCDNKVPQTTRA